MNPTYRNRLIRVHNFKAATHSNVIELLDKPRKSRSFPKSLKIAKSSFLSPTSLPKPEILRGLNVLAKLKDRGQIKKYLIHGFRSTIFVQRKSGFKNRLAMVINIGLAEERLGCRRD